MGRKIVFLVSILIFGVGSVLCGLASNGSFALLLVGRVVQALGAGGIMPIATAEFGTSFPAHFNRAYSVLCYREKRPNRQ